MQNLQKDQKQNLLSVQGQDPENNPNKQQQLLQADKNKTHEKQQLIDPIQQLIKNNNIIPLLAVIDQVDLDRKVDEKPLLCIMASKFIPLHEIFKDKPISNFPSDEDKRTPLHYAIEANDVKAAAWCMQNGNPNQRDNFGNTPILDALRLSRRRCFLLCLKNKYYDQRAPIIAAMYNKHWELRVLHGLRYDIDNVRDQQNRTTFERALEYCSFDCAEFLVRRKNNINISMYQRFTDSKGLIRKLKKIQKQQSLLNRILSLIYPLILLSILFIGLSFSSLLTPNQPFPQQNSAPLYLLIILLIFSLYILMFLFGTIFTNKVYYQIQNPLGMILNQPTYRTLEDICPVCVHFTDMRYDHCYICGCCVEKHHFHSWICVHKNNEVFWILTQFLWLYLSSSVLQEFHQYMVQNNLSLMKFSSFAPMKFIAEFHLLYSHQKYVSLAWLLFLTFLFLYQLFYTLSIFGMMCMRRKYQQVIHSEKYLHLYDVAKVGDSYITKQKRVFSRGVIGGLIRCARNFLVYFFIDN